MFVRILKVKYFDNYFYDYAVQRTKEYEALASLELYLNPRFKVELPGCFVDYTVNMFCLSDATVECSGLSDGNCC